MNPNLIPYSENTRFMPNYEVYFLWLSHKIWKDWKVLEAFCNSTNSWKIINLIIDKCNSRLNIYKTNLVRWVPLDNKSKIRYPNENEKLVWLQRLKREISVFKPKIVYVFWKQVSDFVLKKLELKKISNTEYSNWNTIFILAEHPSYMAVYKRKQIDEYVLKISNRIIGKQI